MAEFGDLGAEFGDLRKNYPQGRRFVAEFGDLPFPFVARRGSGSPIDRVLNNWQYWVVLRGFPAAEVPLIECSKDWRYWAALRGLEAAEVLGQRSDDRLFARDHGAEIEAPGV